MASPSLFHIANNFAEEKTPIFILDIFCYLEIRSFLNRLTSIVKAIPPNVFIEKSKTNFIQNVSQLFFI